MIREFSGLGSYLFVTNMADTHRVVNKVIDEVHVADVKPAYVQTAGVDRQG
ncbi:MAG: hypothetical protein GY896_19095 [Gammaproteobacteria bacterium]|nr:hypothetical protein [Gammaproteobacteria bacterium]